MKERHVELPNKVLWSEAAVFAEGSQELCWGQPTWAEWWCWWITRDGPSSCQSIWPGSWHRLSSPWKTEPYRGAWGLSLGLDGGWAHCLQESCAGGEPFFSAREELREQTCRLWSGRDDRKKVCRSSPRLHRYKSPNTQLYWRTHRDSLSLSGWETDTLIMTKAGSFCFEHHDTGTQIDWRNGLTEHWGPLMGGDLSAQKWWETCVCSVPHWTPQYKRDVTNWSECHTGPWWSLRERETSVMWCETERQNCSAWRRECSWENYPNTWWGTKGDKVKLILVVLSERERGKGQKTEIQKIPLKSKEKYSTVGMTEH